VDRRLAGERSDSEGGWGTSLNLWTLCTCIDASVWCTDLHVVLSHTST